MTDRALSYPTNIVGRYGPNWEPGVLTDHLHLVPADRIRTLASGRPVVVIDALVAIGTSPFREGRAFPVVCSELVSVPTEDGPIDGRCGVPVRHLDDVTCEAHTH